MIFHNDNTNPKRLTPRLIWP